MHASVPPRLLLNRSDNHFRRLFQFAGIDLRRCFCARCVAARSGLFRRTRTWVGHRAYADAYLLGIRVSHRLAFEMPLTVPVPSSGAPARAGRSAAESDKDRCPQPPAHVLGTHP